MVGHPKLTCLARDRTSQLDCFFFALFFYLFGSIKFGASVQGFLSWNFIKAVLTKNGSAIFRRSGGTKLSVEILGEGRCTSKFTATNFLCVSGAAIAAGLSASCTIKVTKAFIGVLTKEFGTGGL